MRPVVFAHGFLAYRQFLVWEFYPGVIEAFQQKNIDAFRPIVHPTATIETRADQLLNAINREIGTHESFHIIAHSMGGLDSRFLASPNGLNQGNRVVSLTTISTPHRGSKMAEGIPEPFKNLWATGAGLLKNMTSSKESQDFLAAIAENQWDSVEQLSPDYLCNVFNPRIIDAPKVHYYSYAGSLFKKKKNFLTSLRKSLASNLCKIKGEHDGLVTVESAKWGTFKGILPADHGEQVGLQIIPWVKNTFDHVSFFLSVAKDLQELEETLFSH